MAFDPTNHDRPESSPEAAETPQPPEQSVPQPVQELDIEPATGDELTAEELAVIVERAEKADEYLALAQRKQAEFENFRRRASKDAAAAGERGARTLAMALLPAIDNLERALEHAPDDADENGFVAGVRHVHSDLVAALQRAGIERFSPEGEPFDPTFHEAVAQQPIEGAEPGTVVEVYQRGYRAGETVVRPARVVVAG